MIMRYYWGLAVGHTYAHKGRPGTSTSQNHIEEPEDNNDSSLNLNHSQELPHEYTGNEPEFSLDDLEDDIPQEGVEENHEPAVGDHGDVNPNDYNEMYGWD